MKLGAWCFIGSLAFGAGRADAIVMKEFYGLSPQARAMYVGAIYDLRISRAEGGKIHPSAECLEKMGFARLMKKISDFVVALPENPGTPERRLYDSMNAAVFMDMFIIDKHCGVPKQ